METTFIADNCKIDIKKIKELTKDSGNKVINLSPEQGWEKIGEYVEHKYFKNDDSSSDKYGQIIRELTEDEFKTYDYGFAINGIVKVVGLGYWIYRNYKTKEEYRVPVCLG